MEGGFTPAAIGQYYNRAYHYSMYRMANSLNHEI